MRSRSARLTLSAAAWVALAAAAFLVIRSDRDIDRLRTAARTFELQAREATSAVDDLRVAHHTYIAEGQGVAFWIPKVAAMSTTLGRAVALLRQSASSTATRSALEAAAKSVAEFGPIDRRARDYNAAGHQLMAEDLIFAESGATAARAGRQIENARLAERQALGAAEDALRKQQVVALTAAATFAALIALALAPVGKAESAIDIAPYAVQADSAFDEVHPGSSPPDLALRLDTEPPPSTTIVRPSSPVLTAAAELCTDLGRVRDVGDLQALLERAADVMDASGLVVWFGSPAGADLRPVLAHGYLAEALARMPSVPRASDNAAASAYRTGRLQIVLSRPGWSSGAVVAPIHSSDGCIGALSAEIRDGGEASEGVQALASILAAQLATILPSAAAAEAGSENRAAASS
jgi:hypothetical protein